MLTPFLLNPRYSVKKKSYILGPEQKMPCRVGNGGGIVENNFSKGIVEYALSRYDYNMIRCSI